MKNYKLPPLLLLVLLVLHFSLASAQSAGKLFKTGAREMKAGKYTEALNDFTKSLELKPGVLKVLMDRAKAYEIIKQPEKALADYNQALILDPKNYKLYIKTAELNMAMNRYSEALTILHKLVLFDEWNRDGLEKIIWCHIMLKQFKEAAEQCDRILKGDKHHYIKQDHIVNFYNGIIQDSLKDYQSAVLSYIKALSLIPNPSSGNRISSEFKTYYVNLATAQFHLGQFDESIKNYTIASTLDPADTVQPHNYRIFYLRSYPYQGKSDYTNTLGDLDHALAMNPKDKDIFLRRAAVYQKTSNYQSSISDYTKAIQLDSTNLLSCRERGACYLELGNYKDAISDLQRAHLLSAKDERTVELLGLSEKKNYEANKENDAPEIKIEYPIADIMNFINIYENQLDVIVSGLVRDKSKLKFIKVNGIDAEVKDEERSHYFKCRVPVNSGLQKIEVSASDIYSNIGTAALKVGKLIDDSRVCVTFRGKLISDDSKKTPVANQAIYMCNEHGEAMYAARTDETGEFKFYKLPFDKNYILTLDLGDSPLSLTQKFIITDLHDKPILHAESGGKARYKFQVLQADYKAMSLMTMDDEPLKVDLKGKLLADNDNRSPLANINVQLVNEKAEVLSTQKTDAYGFFLFPGVLPDLSYSFRIDSADTRLIPVNKIIITDIRGKIIKEISKGVFGYFIYEPLGTERSMLSVISEPDPWLKAIKLNKDNSHLEIIDNLYYESGAFQIMPSFEPELNKAVNSMKENPKLIMEIQSHTDAVAGDDYNMELSQKRASAVAEYMISKGIDKKRITAKGYGETQLINRCSNGVDCSDAEHKQNRRTVFKLSYPSK